MNRERTCINTDKEIWRKIKDDFYSPSIHITEKGGIGINVGGRVIVLPVEKWHELADRIIAEENQLQNKEPIFYDCTLAKFAEQMNVPLYKAMEFGKYFRIIAEEGKDKQPQQPKLPERLEVKRLSLNWAISCCNEVLNYLKAKE